MACSIGRPGDQSGNQLISLPVDESVRRSECRSVSQSVGTYGLWDSLQGDGRMESKRCLGLSKAPLAVD